MNVISYEFPVPAAPSLPPLPPPQFANIPPPELTSGFEAPTYTPVYVRVDGGQFDAVPAPEYATPVDAPGGSVAQVPQMPTIGAFPRAQDPGSAGLSELVKPLIVVDPAPLLQPIGDLLADIEVGSVVSFELPEVPAIPEVDTDLTVPTIAAPQGLVDLVRNHEALSEATRGLMYFVGTEYLDRKAMLAEQKVMADVAGKGFSGPVGMAAADILEIHHENRVAKRKVAEGVRDQSLDLGRERLSTAVAAAIQAEMKAQMSMVEIGKALISHDEQLIAVGKQIVSEFVRLYNTRVSIINETVSAYQGYIQQVEAYNSAVSSSNSVQVAKIENEGNKVDLFEGQMSAVKAFYDVEADAVEARTLPVREFRAYAEYAKAQAQISRDEIAAFAEVVRAYSLTFGVRSAQLQAYAARVEAEGSAADVFSANASAYSNFWRAEGARLQGEGQYISDQARAYGAELQNYSRYSQAFRSYLSSVNTGIEAAENALSTWGQAARGSLRLGGAYNRSSAALAAAQNSVDLQQADADNGRQILLTQSEILAQRIEGSLLQAAAQAASARAQAAYSVTSESARVSYSAQRSLQGSSDNEYRHGLSYNRSWSVSKQHEQPSGV